MSLAPAAEAGQPYLVKDINTAPAPMKAYPDHFVTIGSYVYFTTNTFDNRFALALWRTDGTQAGTIALGPASSTPVAFNGRAWFTYNDRIWSTDGTVAGTTQLTLPITVAATRLMSTSNALYFYATTDLVYGYLWRTDGTTPGTAQVSATRFRLPTEPSDDYRSWASAGANLYFVTTDDTAWTVWRTDGTTTAPAVPVDNLNTFPIALQTFGNLVVFLKTFTNGTGQFWRTDGTANGSFPLTKSQPLSYNGLFVNVVVSGPYIYFAGSDGTGSKLWRSDGSNTGTTILASSLPGASATFDATPLTVLANGSVLLKGPAVAPPVGTYNGLWSFDGTNTTFLANVPYAGREIAVSAGSWAFYGARDEAWRSDGTIAGTYRVGIIQGYDTYHTWPMAALGADVLFANYGPTDFLMKTNGDPNGVTQVREIYVATQPSEPQLLRRLNGGALFTAIEGTTRELWFSDGTSAGTQKILPLSNSQILWDLVPCGGHAFFTISDPQQNELWMTDGTAAGTGMLADLYPGETNSTPNSSDPRSMVCVDHRLYFAATGADATALWRSDGTILGTFAIKAIAPKGFSFSRPVQYGHGIFFTDEHSLWASNGTAEGTFIVKQGAPSALMNTNLVVAGNYVYFTIGVFSPQELWRSNATAAGTTKMLTDDFFRLHTSFNERLVFTWMYTGGFSHGLCSMGGAGDTFCFDPSPSDSGPFNTQFKSLNGRLYYNKPTVYSTDLNSIVNTGFSAVALPAVAGGRLITGGIFSGELNESDGTKAGTTRLMFLSEGTHPDPVESGGRLFIASDELYAYDLAVAAVTLSPATVPVSGGAVTLTGRGFVNPITVKVGGIPAAVGATSATSIAFTAPAREQGTYTVTFTNGDGRIVDVVTPLTYTCTPPSAAINTIPGPVCPMSPVHLQGSGATYCHWYPATGLDNPASCTPTATLAATMTYTLVVNNADGCQSTNHPTVTVPIRDAPDPTITVTSSITPGQSYTASVADAGPGATYSWSGTNLALTAGQTERTVTFHSGCNDGTLHVTVTNGIGCSTASSVNVYPYITMNITAASPVFVRPGTVITASGFGFACATELSLIGASPAVQVPFTVVNDSTLRFTFPPNGPPSSSPYLGLHMLNGVRQTVVRSMRDSLAGTQGAEIVWRNPSTGYTLLWWINPAGVLTTISPYVRNPGTSDYKIVGMNELGTYVVADLLWQRTSTGELSTMFMFVTGVPASEKVWPAIPPPTLKVAATGDFNGDGGAEALMRDTQTGATSIWRYNGNGSVVTQLAVHSGNNLAWTIVAARDFDLDGKDDILWRNDTTGQTLIWFMDDATIRSSKSVHGGNNLEWTIAGTGDFDGDGHADIFWRRNADGLTLLWQLNAGTITASTTVHSGANLNWAVAAIADFDGDWKSDVLWREKNTGATLYWKMSGPQIASSVSLHSGNNLEWQIEGPRF